VNNKIVITLAGSALAILALAGCSMGSNSASSPAKAPASSGSAASGSAASTADAMVGSTGLGKIVVDGKGMTAYVYDKDTPNSGTSACTGQCEALWPAITTTSAKPSVTGVTGTVGTITGVAGGKQLTIDGQPIYTFANDKKVGDTNGQLLLNIWHVISPAGTEISTPNKASGSSDSSNTNGY
jgi:predicted lipoprotein with Yx(FWY)xxD motif